MTLPETEELVSTWVSALESSFCPITHQPFHSDPNTLSSHYYAVNIPFQANSQHLELASTQELSSRG